MTQRRPTALPPVAAEGPAAAPPSAPRSQPTRLPSAAAPPTGVVRAPAAPTRLQGTVRSGLDVDLEAIQRRFPDLAIGGAEAVQRVLRTTVPASLEVRDALAWGAQAQSRYGALVDDALRLGQHPVRAAAQQHMQRLHEILQEVAEAIEQQIQPGLLARWRAGPWELLARHRHEIDDLRKALGGAVDELGAQIEHLEGSRRQMAALTADLQAHALAATWLIESGAPWKDARVPQALLQRATELTATHGHIVSADALRERGDADLQALVAAIRQAVLLLLPAWLEKALHAGHAGASATAARELQRELAALLGRLPGAAP